MVRSSSAKKVSGSAVWQGKLYSALEISLIPFMALAPSAQPGTSRSLRRTLIVLTILFYA
jgi:hypothetical protein